MTKVGGNTYPDNIGLIEIKRLPLPEGRMVYIGRENGAAARRALKLDLKDAEILHNPYDHQVELGLDSRSLGIYTMSYLIGLFSGSYKTLGAARFLQSYQLTYSDGGERLKTHPQWNRDALNLCTRIDRERLLNEI